LHLLAFRSAEMVCRIKLDLRAFWNAADQNLVLIMQDVE
jgi:hypothetical protein